MHSQKNLKSNIVQNLFSVVSGSDKDGDNTIDENEVEDLITKLDSIKGVKINKDLFRQTIQRQGGSLVSIMGIIKGMEEGGDDSKPEDEKVFVLVDL